MAPPGDSSFGHPGRKLCARWWEELPKPRVPLPAIMPAADRLLVPLLALLAACSSSATQEPQPAVEETFVPHQPPQPEPIGKLLADLDLKMRAWTNLTLTARSEEERRRARELGSMLQLETRKRLDELVLELETGPPRNRQRAAAALGFTHDPRVLGPLLAALEDPDLDVVHNALLGLALLSLAETPTETIATLMSEHPDPATRSNAAYALRTVVEAGADPQPVVPAARMALLDSEPGVRLQAALVVGLAADGESVQRLADLLHDEEPLVQLAATEALVLIGQRSGPHKGAAARALVDAWLDAERLFKARLRESMVTLAGKDLGNDDERWVEWSRNLP